MNEIGSISTLSFCFVWQSQWRYSELIKNSFEMEDVCRLIHICRKYRTHEFNATRPIFFLLWNNWTGNKKKSQNESEVGEVNKCIFFLSWIVFDVNVRIHLYMYSREFSLMPSDLHIISLMQTQHFVSLKRIKNYFNF